MLGCVRLPTRLPVVTCYDPTSQRGPHGGRMQRRDFIKVVGGSAVVWPFAARAQQADQVRQIGVLMQLGEGEPQPCVEVAAFLQGLQELGWSEGHNPRIDTEYVFSNINNNGGDQGGQNEVLTPNASYRS